MGKMKERWECLFVDRIDPSGRIYLKTPQKFGWMYRGSDGYPSKIKKSIPKQLGPLIGNSEEYKLLKAISLATAYNRNELRSSEGLVLKGHKSFMKFVAQHSKLVKNYFKDSQIRGTTAWLVYISSEERFYSIINGKFKGNEFHKRKNKLIHECIKSIEEM